MGSKQLFDYVDNNPIFEFHPTAYTNDPALIARNDNMIAINSALQVDLTGQVCSDSIGTYFYSGIGGQVDFLRGASRSKGGKPIIAISARLFAFGPAKSSAINCGPESFVRPSDWKTGAFTPRLLAFAKSTVPCE